MSVKTANKMNSEIRQQSFLAAMLALVLFVPMQLIAGVADFSYKDMEGNTHTLSQYKGKWIVVNYWATWCPPCLEEMPELELFHNNYYPDKAVVLGVNMEDIGHDKIASFVEDQFLSFPILPAGERAIPHLGRIPGLPTTFLVAPNGEVVARQVGGLTAETLEVFIANYEEQIGR